MSTLFTDLAKVIVEGRHTDVGVRHCCEDEQVKAGDALRDSYNWDSESDVSMYFTTGETLNGACAIGLSQDSEALLEAVYEVDIEAVAKMLQAAYETASTYADNGGAIVLVVGEGSSVGTDDGEVIIRYPKVLHVFA